MNKLALAAATVAMTLGAATADEAVERPSRPPDLFLLCYPEIKTFPRGNKPEVIEIWLTQNILAEGGVVYRVEVTPIRFRYSRANEKFKWHELDEIDRLTGRMVMQWFSDDPRIPNTEEGMVFLCQKASQQF